MKRKDTNMLVGLMLLGAGVLFLLLNLGILGSAEAAIWAMLFAAGGTAFVWVFWRDRERWWALIPGCTLLSIGILIGLDKLAPAFAGVAGGALVLGGLSLSFWAIYLTDRARWWAVIPAGVLLTLVAIVVLSLQLPGQDLAWVLFLGIALTFGLVYLLPAGEGRNRWAIYPAAVMLLMALLLMATLGQMINILWPLLLIAGGITLIWRRLKGVPA
ncbi:MAG TPA: hypothetical protein VFU22_30240 [Roseiflexaceae bacterium]|nr:hypothetical protein [Roseiflexaceae bacterium]